MNRPGSPTLIGAFVVGGLVLVLAAIIVAGGGRFFTRKEHAVMYFRGSIYGLQVGAPVVFRGVRLGSVTHIGLAYDAPTDTFTIPVRADLEPGTIRGLGHGDAGQHTRALGALLAKGLKAQLSMQSLLTGQLYVDLDLRPKKPVVLRHPASDDAAEIEIPTSPAPIQSLKDQLDGMDFKRLLDDVSAIAAATRATLAGPQLKQVMANLVQITDSTRRITARLEKRLPPLTDAATAALADTQRAMGKVGDAADNVSALVDDNSPTVRAIHNAADELARSAAALRAQTAEGAPLIQNTNRALQDVARAARAVRELATLLDEQPQSLLRGRSAAVAEPEVEDAAQPPVHAETHP
jgi:paraquat-inducible protein B